MNSSGAAWQQLIAGLHASGRKAALAITGGGSGAIAELLRVPGGSRLLIEAQIPYDAQALAMFLGFAPARACSAETAIAMARTARARAASLAPADSEGGTELVGRDLVGLGATAALVSDRPRKGEHRFHIAFANAAGIAHCTCVMAKGRRDRAAEEDLVSRAIVLWLARACGVVAPSPRSLLDADEHYAETVLPPVDAPTDTIDQLLAGEVDRVTVQPDGQMMLSAPTTNVDKPPLAGETVRERLAQFAWKAPVELTRAPTFLEKARLFPGTTFVIGADTAERLVAPKYYGGDELRMHMALEEIASSGSSFLVGMRIDAAGRVRALNDIAVPRRYADLFTEIPEHRFRLDTSSSEIRARGRAVGNR